MRIYIYLSGEFTMLQKLNILVVDDEKIIRNEIVEFLEDELYSVFEADKPSACMKILEEKNIDIIFLDINLPEMSGLELLKIIKDKYNYIEVIMMTGHGDVDKVIQAMRFGSMDFFYKPLRLIEMQAAIERTKKYISLKNQLSVMSKNFLILSGELQNSMGIIIGKSKVLSNVLELSIQAAMANDTSVLITGPSGSGKELIARAIHFASARKKNYFYPLNCSAIPDNLLESELFGYKRGAFTGASEDRKGCFEAADNGTLFLDEIGDMPLNLQAKLLRTLEDKTIKKIGSNSIIELNVRIISATNRNISELIRLEKFRLDLYYRLNTLEIFVPGLNERREDIPLLVEHYIHYFSVKQNKTISAATDLAMDKLVNYDFPGNIRELKNIIERAVILCKENKIDEKHIQIGNIEPIAAIKPGENKTEILNLKELEKMAITEALKKNDNNKIDAAKLLGISYFSLCRKLKKK